MKNIYIVYPKKTGHIAPEIYGHFSEHIGGVFYDGLYVGKDSKIPNIKGFRRELIEKLREINPPVLRWPGGCFAETYDWRDGIGENRPARINWWTRYDGRYESNAVGTHEFTDLCEALGCHAYFAANLTSVPPIHILNWMDYCLSPRGSTALAQERERNGHPEPFDIPFWGVGNENWGGGGNMTPEYYAGEYRRFSQLLHNAFPAAKLFACGSNGPDYNWTHGVSASISPKSVHTDGFAMHYYCGKAGDPLNFTNEEWTKLLRQASAMEDIIKRNYAILCGYGLGERCKLVVDEWGCWHPDGSGPSKGYNLFEQQSTMRDAAVTALTLNIFNNNCDKVIMANVAQLVNNLHSLFLASGDKFTVTPTYHVFRMFRDHQDADAVETLVSDNDVFENSLSVSASVKAEKTLLTVCNISCTDDAEFTVIPLGGDIPATADMTLLAHSDLHAHNTFEYPDEVLTVSQKVDLRHPLVIPKGSVCAISF